MTLFFCEDMSYIYYTFQDKSTTMQNQEKGGGEGAGKQERIDRVATASYLLSQTTCAM